MQLVTYNRKYKHFYTPYFLINLSAARLIFAHLRAGRYELCEKFFKKEGMALFRYSEKNRVQSSRGALPR
jgi:hypothetical protein